MTLALLRLDDAFAEHLRTQRALPSIARRCLVAIVIGAGAYGAAFGLWRAPAQTIYGAVKLPIVLLCVALFTAASSAVLAPMLGARLRPMQSITVILTSLAVTASILGSVAPIAIVLSLSLAPLGGPNDAMIAQSLVLAHTLVIALAGIAGVLALLRLLTRIVPSRNVARRVALAWMATQLLCGAQLSWLLRPFLGRPDRPVTFLSPDALDGGFFDEIGRLAHARFGDASPYVLGWLVLMLAFWIVVALLHRSQNTRVNVGPGGLDVVRDDEARRTIAWQRVALASAVGLSVVIRLTRDASLVEESIDVPCRSLVEAAALARAIELACTASAGPYR